MNAVTENAEKNEIAIINEENIKDKIYIIREQQVMLDFELAELYGYETKNFNRQVKNNIDKFDEDFMFQLTHEEFENLRCKKFTSSWGGTRYLPYAFTEQGIYMLMTVLKGDLATQQSKALIRTFKKMKDYITENRYLISQRELMQLTLQTANNTAEISKLRSDLGSVEHQISDVMNLLNDVVTKSDISEMMTDFADNSDNGRLIFNTKYCSADLAYSTIYGCAKKTIYVVDNYIGLKTLINLKNAAPDVDITLFSDNVGSRKLSLIEYNDFCKEYPNCKITLKETAGVFHDRFIVLDHNTENERIFLCGASSKDAGSRITSIVEDYGIEKYRSMINNLLQNKALQLH